MFSIFLKTNFTFLFYRVFLVNVLVMVRFKILPKDVLKCVKMNDKMNYREILTTKYLKNTSVKRFTYSLVYIIIYPNNNRSVNFHYFYFIIIYYLIIT